MGPTSLTNYSVSFQLHNCTTLSLSLSLTMATPLQLSLLLLTSIFISPTTIVTAIDSSPSYSFPLLAPILANLGFQQLSSAAAASLSTPTPATIFAPTDSSLLTCPSCSLPLLLQEHIISGLYTLPHLRSLPFGTKIETLAPRHCITITDDKISREVFVGGMEITMPDLYNDGYVVVHGIQGFVAHLSPLSCHIERMNSLSFPSPPPSTAVFSVMPQMLQDAMLRLRISGFSVLALALRVKYSELSALTAMTVFALDDSSIFTGGHSYVSDLRLHIVPNRRLMGADLESLAAATVLPTMEKGEKLVVTTASGGGPLAPMRINYAKITSFDLIYNLNIAVHAVSMPFTHVNQTDGVDSNRIRDCKQDDLGSKVAAKSGICQIDTHR
ncbi:Fasciclin-like arabinogalactan protein 21 [Camellia lanceoleosa]|uniref:Fasciclin-like arabinogalactan protein 21 n=1 Tax=Camellia lanceoleosa TaxID=1840588 RepID=A0ACC0F597_9ERIC|nr:Fasciclin-like arabinogalactan protein 21 [Camellia lanceoleosa]